MDSSENVEKVSAALVAALADARNVALDAVNPHFRSRYASLPAMLDAVRPILAKHGLAAVQLAVSEPDGRVGVETILLHASGQYLASRILVMPTKGDPQGAGSALTYCRRYALAAALGIAGDEDDDGNAASRKPTQRPAAPAEQRQPQPPATRPQNGVISEAQGERVWGLAGERARAVPGVDRTEIVRDVLARRGIAHTNEVPRDAYERICAEVEKWEPPVGDDGPPRTDEEVF